MTVYLIYRHTSIQGVITLMQSCSRYSSPGRYAIHSCTG